MNRRPLKYIEGEPIETIGEFAEHIAAGGYLIEKRTKQRIHPSWAGSWQFNMCVNAIRRRSLLRAVPNPEHPDAPQVGPLLLTAQNIALLHNKEPIT